MCIFHFSEKLQQGLLAKTILIDTALASNPMKEQKFHPQRKKCRSMSKRNNSSERNTIGIVNGHLGVVGRNADVLYFNWRHRYLGFLLQPYSNPTRSQKTLLVLA